MLDVRKSVKMLQEGKTPPLKLTLDRITVLRNIGFEFRPKRGHDALISEIPSTSCNVFKRQRVEEGLHEKHEEMPTTRTFTSANENKETEEEIEGDIVPKWLIGDEEENENDDSLLDEISTEIDGGTDEIIFFDTPGLLKTEK